MRRVSAAKNSNFSVPTSAERTQIMDERRDEDEEAASKLKSIATTNRYSVQLMLGTMAPIQQFTSPKYTIGPWQYGRCPNILATCTNQFSGYKDAQLLCEKNGGGF